MTELEKSIIKLTNKISDKKLLGRLLFQDKITVYYSLKDIEKTIQNLIKQEKRVGVDNSLHQK